MLSLGLELDLYLTLMPMILQWVDPDLRLSLMLGLDLVGGYHHKQSQRAGITGGDIGFSIEITCMQ